MALVHFMRPSLRKGAYAALSSAAWQEIRVRSGRDDKGESGASISSSIVDGRTALASIFQDGSQKENRRNAMVCVPAAGWGYFFFLTEPPAVPVPRKTRTGGVPLLLPPL